MCYWIYLRDSVENDGDAENYEKFVILPFTQTGSCTNIHKIR